MCSVCKDFGFFRRDIEVGHPDFGKLIRCACKGPEDAKRLQHLSGLTDSERMIRLDAIETDGRPGTRRMVEVCKNFTTNPYGIITLWGGSGNAKTMALQAVVNEFVSQNREAVYITAFDLISYIRSSFNREREVVDDNAYSRLLMFERVKMLAIDEFDKVRVTDWVQEQLTDLIDRRYRVALDGKSGTIVAMNDDPRGLPAWMYSRLAQNLIVHNDDNDMRPIFGELNYGMSNTQIHS